MHRDQLDELYKMIYSDFLLKNFKNSLLFSISQITQIELRPQISKAPVVKDTLYHIDSGIFTHNYIGCVYFTHRKQNDFDINFGLKCDPLG